jgi:hypothetical protein
VKNGAVAERDQVLDGVAGTLVLVDGHTVEADLVAGLDREQRNAELDAPNRLDGGMSRGDDDDRLDVLAKQQVDGCSHRFAIRVEHARHAHGVARLPCRLVESDDGAGRAEIRGPRCHEPNRARTSRHEGARGG